MFILPLFVCTLKNKNSLPFPKSFFWLFCIYEMLSTEHSISYEHSVMFSGNFLDAEMNTGALTLGYKHIFQNVNLLFCAGMYHLQITPCLTYTRPFWMVFLLMLQQTQVGQIVHFFQLLNCCGVFDNGCTVSRCISLHILSILLSYIMLHLWILQWIQMLRNLHFSLQQKLPYTSSFHLDCLFLVMHGHITPVLISTLRMLYSFLVQ